MQNNDNFFISEELLDIFDEKSLADKKEIEDLVYEITSDNLTHKCNIVKLKSFKDYNRITLKAYFNILSYLYLKKETIFIIRNKSKVIEKVDINLNLKGLSIKHDKDNIYIIKLNLEKASHGI